MNVALIGKGAIKLVYAGASNLVFYVPRHIPLLHLPLPWCKHELRQEVETAALIKKAVASAGRSIDHLAVDLVHSPQSILGHYTVQAPRALSDLEEAIKRKDLSFPTRLNLCLHTLDGFSALHAAGYLHGDPKPENMLVYREDDQLCTKISDWGKAKKQAPSETTGYTGNTRFAPPEYRTSYPGEVYGVGLILLRILEEAILSQAGSQEMLIKPLKQRILILDKAHRGYLKYIFSHFDSYYPRVKWMRKSKAWFYKNDPSVDAAKKLKNQKLAYIYLAELSKQLSEKGFCSTSTAEGLSTLIKEMIQLDPTARPTAQTAYDTFQRLVAQHLKEQTPPVAKESIWQRFFWRPLQTLHDAVALWEG